MENIGHIKFVENVSSYCPFCYGGEGSLYSETLGTRIKYYVFCPKCEGSTGTSSKDQVLKWWKGDGYEKMFDMQQAD